MVYGRDFSARYQLSLKKRAELFATAQRYTKSAPKPNATAAVPSETSRQSGTKYTVMAPAAANAAEFHADTEAMPTAAPMTSAAATATHS